MWPTDARRSVRAMPWIAGGLLLYLVLVGTLGVLTFRRGHLVLFWVGFLFPVCWLFGSLLAPAPGHSTGLHPSTTAKGPEHHGRVTTSDGK
jgi:hypothetical protein